MNLESKQNNLIRWDAKGVPHSLMFRDKYFCTQNGYEECCYVSNQGNNLRERFSNLDAHKPGVFVIIETGFGTGLSFCCAWQLWRECAPASWKLHFISVELYPLSPEDLTRALTIWPALSEFKDLLSSKYKVGDGAIEHFHFEEHQVQLTIAFDDVVLALKKIHDSQIVSQGADAWLLNGFSPFSNPLMWTPDVFKGMALLSKPGTTLSTFTVATAVRKGLENEGFAVEKVKGYGTKREVLKGFFVGKRM